MPSLSSRVLVSSAPVVVKSQELGLELLFYQKTGNQIIMQERCSEIQMMMTQRKLLGRSTWLWKMFFPLTPLTPRIITTDSGLVVGVSKPKLDACHDITGSLTSFQIILMFSNPSKAVDNSD